MSAATSDQAARVEREVAGVPGVRSLYPVSALPGSARVALSERDGRLHCELRVAADRDVPARDLIRAVTDAARRALDAPSLDVHLEFASID